MGEIIDMLLANIRKCHTLTQMQKLYDLIWERADGDRSLINIAIARESSSFGAIDKEYWIRTITLTPIPERDEYMCMSQLSEYALFVKAASDGEAFMKLIQIYESANEH